MTASQLSTTLSFAKTELSPAVKTSVPVSKLEQDTKHLGESLKSFGIYYVGELEPEAIARRNEALKKEVWLYPNSFLDYSALIQSQKLGISSEQLQKRIDVFFPPLKISALDFCQFIKKHLGVAPFLGGSTVGHCFFNLKNHDLDFKIFTHQKGRFHSTEVMLRELYCAYILQILQAQSVPLDFKNHNILELVKSVYLYTNLPIYNPSRSQCEAVFTNLGHDLMCIINPDFRWYLATHDQLLLSVEDNSIYCFSSQKESSPGDIQSNLKEKVDCALGHLKNKQYVVRNPLQSHNLFVRLIHATLKEFSIDSPSTIIPIALNQLEKEYKSNTALFIKRIHSVLEKFNESDDAINLLLVTLSLLQQIKEPKLREQWCSIASQPLCISTSQNLTASIKSKPQKDFSDLLLLIKSSSKSPIEKKPPLFVPQKKDLEVAAFIQRHPEITEDFLIVLNGILLLEHEQNPRASQLRKILLNDYSSEETIYRCASSWLGIKKFAKELIPVLKAIGLSSVYFENDNDLFLQSLLKYLDSSKFKIDTSKPTFQIFNKIVFSELSDTKILKHLKAKSDLNLCLSKMSSAERKTPWGWGEFITIFSFRMKTKGFCPPLNYIQQLNIRLEKLLESPANSDIKKGLTESIHLMMENVLTKQPQNIKLLYEIKRFNNYAKQLGLITDEFSESIDQQIIKISFDIKPDEQPDLYFPFYQLWLQNSAFLSKEPRFASHILGGVLKYAATLASSDTAANLDFLYVCLDEALKTSFCAEHYQSINFIYQKLLTHAIKGGDKKTQTKLGLIMIKLLETSKGISLQQNEVSQVLQLIESLLQLSKKNAKAEIEHYIGIKLVHYLAENCKIDASHQKSLLLKCSSIVLLDKSSDKTQRIYKKSIELIFRQQSHTDESATKVCEHLTANLDHRSSLIGRFIEFVASQNIEEGERFLKLFKPILDSLDFDQAHFHLCKIQLATNQKEYLKKAYQSWKSHHPNPKSLTIHFTFGKMFFDSILKNTQGKNYAWLQNCLQEFIISLHRFNESIKISQLTEKNQLTLMIEEINKISCSLEDKGFEPLIQKLWDVSSELGLINREKTSMPLILIERALGDSQVPPAAFEAIQKFDHGKFMNSEAIRWGNQLFKNIIQDPVYRESHKDKILPIAVRLLQADSKLVSNAIKLQLFQALISKRLYTELTHLISECPKEFMELCEANPRNWENLSTAILYCTELADELNIIAPFQYEIISKEKILTSFFQNSYIVLIELITKHCKKFPFYHDEHAVSIRRILNQPKLQNSKTLRNLLELFINTLADIKTYEATIEICKIYIMYHAFHELKYNKRIRYFGSLQTLTKILEALLPYANKPDKNQGIISQMIMQILHNFHNTEELKGIENFTELQDVINFVKRGFDPITIENESKNSSARQRQDDQSSRQVSQAADPTRTLKKSWLLSKGLEEINAQGVFGLWGLAEGCVRGEISTYARIVSEQALGHIATRDTLLSNSAKICMRFGLFTAMTEYRYRLHAQQTAPDHSTLDKIQKVSKKRFITNSIALGSCILIQILSRLYMSNKNYDNYGDLVDLFALILPFSVFSSKDYYEEDILTIVTSAFYSFYTRRVLKVYT